MSGGHSHGGVEEVASLDSPIHRLDPRSKIIGLIGLVIVTVTMPVGVWFAYAAVFALLVVLFAVARLPVRYVLRRMNVEWPFLVLAAILPFTVADGLRIGVSLAIRITICVLAMVILSSTTPFPRLLRGFELLRAPKLIVAIIAFMWRYLHVMTEELARLQTARAARGYTARWFWQALSTGPLLATLFIRALERGERVYLAMLSRGYTGGIPAGLGERLALRSTDAAFIGGVAGALLIVRVVLV